MGWIPRINYLAAKSEVRQIELYGMDLIWKLVKSKYEGNIPMPSEIWFEKPKDTRSAKQIIKETLNGLGGE